MESPPAIHFGIYSYSSRGFFISAAPHVERLAGQTLKEMLDPTLVEDTTERKRLEKKARRLISGRWVSAHLGFYAIQTSSDEKWRTKLKLLKDAAKAGQCESVPRNVLEIHCWLADQFNAESAQLLSCPSSKSQETFQKASSETVEANLDRHQFFRKHFWGPHGTAGQGRKKGPMILIGLNDVNEMIEAAKSLGLKTTRVLEGGRAILVIGGPEIENIKVASTLEHDKGKDKHSPQDVLDPASLAKFKEVLLSSPNTGSLLQRASGQYMVKSKDTEVQWQSHRDHDLEKMSLQISKNHYDGWVGQFNLGAFSGVMILDTDVNRLNSRWMKSKNGSCRVPEWESDSEYGDDDSGDEIPACGENHDGSKHAPPKYKVRFNGARRQFRPSNFTNGQPLRHVKTRADDSNVMVYFRWLSKELYEGKFRIETEPRDAQEGALKFLNEECTVFEGSIGGSWLGEDISFQGFKCSQQTESYF